MEGKKFDLNIEEILEDWEVFHGIREIIANALDEELLSGSDERIEIFEDDEGNWHIRDYGRGLKYEHLTQKECDEKQHWQIRYQKIHQETLVGCHCNSGNIFLPTFFEPNQ